MVVAFYCFLCVSDRWDMLGGDVVQTVGRMGVRTRCGFGACRTIRQFYCTKPLVPFHSVKPKVYLNPP